MGITLSSETEAILCRTLGCKRLSDVMDRDYASLDEAHDVDREKAMRHARRNRGSIRISRGKFYTLKEYAERIRRIKKLRLP